MLALRPGRQSAPILPLRKPTAESGVWLAGPLDCLGHTILIPQHLNQYVRSLPAVDCRVLEF